MVLSWEGSGGGLTLRCVGGGYVSGQIGGWTAARAVSAAVLVKTGGVELLLYRCDPPATEHQY